MDVLCLLKLVFITAPAQLALVKPPDQEEEEEEEEEEELPYPILIMDGSSPSLVHVPVQALTAMIKSQVPVAEDARFLEKQGHGVREGESENGGGCAVCLSRIEKRDEVRELSNCSHAIRCR
ncbi:hypothetical protein NL676_009902 [Syzygium grande]|nr:hypothetical protein NL676_009902 [Syzygium grande]